MQSGAGRHHRCSLQLRSTTVTTRTRVGQSVPGKSVGFVTVLGPTALDPSFVLSQPVWLWTVSVGLSCFYVYVRGSTPLCIHH